MPQVTVYIREQDLEKWKALPKKSEFIHKALNPNEELSPNGGWIKEGTGWKPNPKSKVPARAAVQPIIKTKGDAVEAVKQLFPDAKVVTPLYRDKKNKKL